MNFFNLSFLDPIRSLRCQPSCVNDWALKFKILRQIFHFLSFIENLKVLTKDIISPVKLQFVLRGRIWLFYRFFFYNLYSFCILISVLSFFQQTLMLFGMQDPYSHGEYNGQAIQENI